ncbi:hypothetical protein [Clostridium sp. D53t1_180928_C8]|uniref:hypothetical protein n=1 Tax=Clostridium sp. D53t1_180928_C8 TaxID=2787101 RepID=UPI0018AC4FA3|nr:hypothetical protein [Clostridium sp. D53t1_180928_C8]
MTIYNYDKHEDYKFEYKKDHILVDKYYNTTKKYAPYTSMMSNNNLTEQEFDNICEDWYARKYREEAAKAAHKKAS